VTGALYHASLDAILAEIAAEPSLTGCLLLIGHNPGLEESIRRLTARVVPLPTAGAALLSFAGRAGWTRAAGSQRWSLERLLEPRWG
jgi:phosphohistidine phosphatase SixA